MNKYLDYLLRLVAVSAIPLLVWGATTQTCSSCGGGGGGLGVIPDETTCQAISLTGSQNNWNPTNFQTADCFIVTSDGAHQNTGLVAPSPEAQVVKWFYTTNGSTMWRWNNESGSSTAANRVYVPGDISFYAMSPKAWVAMMYMPSVDRWHIISENNDYYE